MPRAVRILALLPLAALAAAAEPSRGLEFLGRFHPVVVHLPIGLLIAVALVEARTWWQGARQPDPARGVLLVAATVGAVVAVGLGLALAQGGEYDPDQLGWHQWLGIAVAVAGGWLIALHHLEWRHHRLRPLFRLALAGSVVLLGVTGHAGGTLTHGPGYLTRYAPTWLGGVPPRPALLAPPAPTAPTEPSPAPAVEPPSMAPEPVGEVTMPSPPANDDPPPLRPVVPPRDPGRATTPPEAMMDEPMAAPAAAGGPDFARDIAPILAARCTECHGDTKQKGGLRLDSPAAIRTGSKKGAVLVPGAPERSSLFTSVALPADDPDIMPARGEPLSAAQIALIKAWISAGALFAAPGNSEAPTQAKPPPTTAKPAASGPPPATAYDQLATGLAKPDSGTIEAITAGGGVVTPLSRNGALLEVNLAHTRAPLTANHLQQLARIGSNIAWLDLAGSTVGDGMLAQLKALPNLRRLHLERTAIGDSGLVHLTGLKALEYLNLVGTKVSDAGLYRLHGLDRLERVYLWQSQVTAAGAKKLQAALPKAQINFGQ